MITTYHRPSQHIVLNQHPDQLLEAQPKKNFSLAFNPGWDLHHACFFCLLLHKLGFLCSFRGEYITQPPNQLSEKLGAALIV